MSPLTVLLLSDDPALLADECGGRVPTMYLDAVAGQSRPCPVCGAPTRWWSAPTEQEDSCYICTADAGHAFLQPAVVEEAWRLGRHRDAPKALLVMRDNVPVEMSCDRAARWSGRLMSDRLTPEEAMQIARWCRSQRGARVVLLRDGREVES